MNKHIISKFKDYCRKELNLQEVDIEGFLDIYNDRTRKLDGFLNQEKYALLMTYYNFFDEEGNLNYDSIDEHDELEFTNLDNLQPNSKITVTNKTKNNTFTVLLPYNEEQINMLQKGGLLNTLK